MSIITRFSLMEFLDDPVSGTVISLAASFN